MGKTEVLLALPEARGEVELINPSQTVPDIIREILDCHELFARDYDRIAKFFLADTITGICDKIIDFEETCIKYREETDKAQTVRSPAAILEMGEGDCKHFASFAGGVLDAINRSGKKIKWCYRFASYRAWQRTPYHVFVVVWKKDGEELWIDPTPGAEGKVPVYIQDEKIAVMPLYRISGVGVQEYYADPVPDLDQNLPPDVVTAAATLIQYGAVDSNGDLRMDWLDTIIANLPEADALQLTNALSTLQAAQVGGIFDTIFRGVKKVSLIVPRGAFLSAVALNIFGMATKLKQATATQDGINQVRNKWYSLGGDWAKLRQAIDNGSKRSRIGNTVGVAAAVPAWVATASAIIAAIMPIVNAVLKNQKAAGMDMTAFENAYGSGAYNDTSSGSGGVWQWVEQNPVAVLAGGFLLVNFVLLKKGSRIIEV